MTLTQFDGRGYGLRIHSSIVIPGTMPIAGPGAADVIVDFDPTPSWAAVKAAGPYRAASIDRFDFTMPDMARYTIIDRRRIAIDRFPEAGSDDIAAMLVATALPALLWARGAIVLHAAAAVFPGTDKAIAVAGASGIGKSRWLADALARGARAIADDSLCLRVAGDEILASGLPGGYFMRRGGVAEHREFRPLPPDRQIAEAPLGAIEFWESDEPARPLTGAPAVAALLRHRHRPRITALLGLEPAMLSMIATVAQSVTLTLR